MENGFWLILIMYKEIIKYRKLETALCLLNKLGFPIRKVRKVLKNNREYSLDEAISYLHSLKKDPGNSAIAGTKKELSKYDLQIVIPVFNSASTIQTCIESVLKQETQFSVLVNVIDDGSTDDSAKIIKKILKNNKIKSKIDFKYTYQKNQGFSGARNKGLKSIEGKYIMFIDSDDMILPDTINNLLSYGIKNKSDIVEGSFDYFNLKRTWNGIHHLTRNNIDNLDLITGMPWGKIYKADLWEKVEFPKNYLFEDTIIKYLIASRAKKISTISDVVYKYRKSKKSISFTSKTDIDSLDTFYVTKQCLEDCEKLNILYNEKLYNLTLEQMVVNDKRLRNFPKRIRLAVFTVSCNLIAKYFADVRTNKDILRDIEKGIRQKNYSYFFVSTIELKL